MILFLYFDLIYHVYLIIQHRYYNLILVGYQLNNVTFCLDELFEVVNDLIIILRFKCLVIKLLRLDFGLIVLRLVGLRGLLEALIL